MYCLPQTFRVCCPQHGSNSAKASPTRGTYARGSNQSSPLKSCPVTRLPGTWGTQWCAVPGGTPSVLSSFPGTPVPGYRLLRPFETEIDNSASHQEFFSILQSRATVNARILWVRGGRRAGRERGWRALRLVTRRETERGRVIRSRPRSARTGIRRAGRRRSDRPVRRRGRRERESIGLRGDP
jgi:hypothetical protein